MSSMWYAEQIDARQKQESRAGECQQQDCCMTSALRQQTFWILRRLSAGVLACAGELM